MTEMRGNWEGRNILGWTRMPAERTCRYCRRSVMHTKTEHDLVYPIDRQVELDFDRLYTERQVQADTNILESLLAKGMTEEQAADELWCMMGRGEGLVERVVPGG